MSGEASQTDTNLDELDLYKSGDRLAFLGLWERHQLFFAAYVRKRMPGNEHPAEDLLQDAAAKLMDSRVRATYDRGQPWRAWVCRILHNLIVDFFRKRACCDYAPLDVETLADPAPSTQDDGLRGDLDDCLGALPPPLRDLLVRRFVDGEQQNEIARAISRSPASVSKNLDKARILLARCLEGKGHGDWLR